MRHRSAIRTLSGWCLSALMGLALCPAPAGAEIIGMPLDLDEAVNRSRWVLAGRLYPSGGLVVTALLKGPAPLPTQFGPHYYSLLGAPVRQSGTEPLHVVLFIPGSRLNGEWRAGHPQRAVLHGEAVYTLRRVESSFPQILERDPAYTPASFLAAVRASVAAAGEWARLHAMRRSPERDARIVSFVRRHGRASARSVDPEDGFFQDPSYYAQKAAALLERGPAHTPRILAALREARTLNARAALLDLAGLVGSGPDAASAVVPFTGRQYPAPVREAAIRALATLDPARAADVFAGLLSPSDPQLLDLLWAIQQWNSRRERPAVSPALVDALEVLARELEAAPFVGTGRNLPLIAARSVARSYAGAPPAPGRQPGR